MSEDAAPPREPPAPEPGNAFRGQRARDAAIILPLFGLALIAPPFVNLFVGGRSLLGVPLLAVYLFAVWAALILAALRLSFSLHRELRQDSGR